jgi:hypothetical protein
MKYFFFSFMWKFYFKKHFSINALLQKKLLLIDTGYFKFPVFRESLSLFGIKKVCFIMKNSVQLNEEDKRMRKINQKTILIKNEKIIPRKNNIFWQKSRTENDYGPSVLILANMILLLKQDSIKMVLSSND